MGKLIYFLQSFRWQDVVDIGLNSYILFRFYVLFRGTYVFRVLIGLTMLWFFQQMASYMGLIVTSWVVQGIVAVAALIIVVVFRNEIRSVLQARNFKTIFWGFTSKTRIAPIDIIAESAFELARRRHGALIVIPGEEDVQELIQSGIAWNGDISREMILSMYQYACMPKACTQIRIANPKYRMSNKEFRMMKFDGFVKSLPGRHSREGGSPEALVKTGFPPPRE